mmetsp:Transcript_2918/g.5907  ORF Transcript_2918/g.5907 Transcript_2918/m.5907 type:complete len:112 (+) Transcript_2918:778-1113(+)
MRSIHTQPHMCADIIISMTNFNIRIVVLKTFEPVCISHFRNTRRNFAILANFKNRKILTTLKSELSPEATPALHIIWSIGTDEIKSNANQPIMYRFAIMLWSFIKSIVSSE